MTELLLITRADDIGSSLSANRATEDALAAGLIKNVGFMAVGPAIEDAAERFRSRKDVALGFHVALTCEWEYPLWGPIVGPVRGASLLDARGAFHRDSSAIHQAGVLLEQIVEEVEAQLATLRALGLRLSYMDEHMGIGWLPGVADALDAIARREGLVYARNIVAPQLPEAPSGGDRVARFLTALRAAPRPGPYLAIVHPAYPDAEMDAYHMASQPPGQEALHRDWQRLQLSREDVIAAFAELGVSPVRYDAL